MENYDFKSIAEGHSEGYGDAFGYCFFNPNCRGKRTGDCVKRAIVVATGMDYKELELFMNRNKVRKDEPYNDRRNYQHAIGLLGGELVKMSVPAGTKRWHVNTVGRLVKGMPNVRLVLQVAGRLIGVRDGVIFDLFDDRRYDKGIYKMFAFGATKEQLASIRRNAAAGDTRFRL